MLKNMEVLAPLQMNNNRQTEMEMNDYNTFRDTKAESRSKSKSRA
jgi:hypothetical protein